MDRHEWPEENLPAKGKEASRITERELSALHKELSSRLTRFSINHKANRGFEEAHKLLLNISNGQHKQLTQTQLRLIEGYFERTKPFLKR